MHVVPIHRQIEEWHDADRLLCGSRRREIIKLDILIVECPLKTALRFAATTRRERLALARRARRRFILTGRPRAAFKMLRGELAPQRHAPFAIVCPLLKQCHHLGQHQIEVGRRVIM